ncbi:hypothetical protein [Tautonia rosea]|uniref:hypothetical protein n=1 Tax=Tautonia rosea TaxID=2728037 RepID=UPI0015FF7E49|nr:hypothetical protein [Tautonia rosea]
MRLARWLFLGAGLSGLLAILPQYALEGWINRQFPPVITHPEYFYGFVGLAAAWQVVFLVIASDPIRYRPLMLVGILEKATFGGAAVALFLQGRVGGSVLGPGLVDLVFGGLFWVAYLATAARDHAVSEGTGCPGADLRDPGPEGGP